jgi:uncharacterized protein YbaR (Trm112 family)
MPVDAELLAILVCPENHLPVKPADPPLVASLNAQAQAGTLKNRQGKPVPGPIEEALIREDGKCVYLVVDSIPIMLIEERIDMPADQEAG